MRQRSNKLTLYLDDTELEELRRKAGAACMDCNRYLRMLIEDKEPRAAPDDRFWSAMDIMREFADKLELIAMNAEGKPDVVAIMGEARKWRMLQNTIEKEFLRPKRGDEGGSN